MNGVKWKQGGEMNRWSDQIYTLKLAVVVELEDASVKIMKFGLVLAIILVCM